MLGDRLLSTAVAGSKMSTVTDLDGVACGCGHAS
jgi:hypothetical protein